MLKKSFRGGIHPHEGQNGKAVMGAKAIELAKSPERVAIMLAQSIGAPAEALVKPGERVLMYQKIGEPKSAVGAPVHASVSGKVVGIQQRINSQGMMGMAVVIDNDGLDEPCSCPQGIAPEKADPKTLLSAIREAGIVGLGGAAFPTQIKLSPPQGTVIDTVILNGAECEPYLSCDHRIMLERPLDVIDGLLIAKRILGAAHACIGIEANKPDAIISIENVAQPHNIEVLTLRAKYPQGGEKQLIKAATGREVPSGKLPMDVSCVVLNVSTAAAISQAIRTGKPLIDRVVTIAGAAREPKNLRARIGTSIHELIDQCGGLPGKVDKVVLGGPMMGTAAASLETPTVKATSGVVLMTGAKLPRQSHCIRCARCAGSCPINLLPMQLHILTEHNRIDEAATYHPMDCIECGCCSYVCPAKLPLVESIRIAKRELIRRKSREGRA